VAPSDDALREHGVATGRVDAGAGDGGTKRGAGWQAPQHGKRKARL
jgi:hypothetical protein